MCHIPLIGFPSRLIPNLSGSRGLNPNAPPTLKSQTSTFDYSVEAHGPMTPRQNISLAELLGTPATEASSKRHQEDDLDEEKVFLAAYPELPKHGNGESWRVVVGQQLTVRAVKSNAL